jgi:anaerobic selenocysteine-containing dehydrogenase
MSEINKTSQQSLQRILDKIGVKSANEKKEEVNKSTLGQEDFLKLMTTQLQNQDPFAPMENGDFRKDPLKNSLTTPSGKIEIFSQTVANFNYEDCPGHPVWIEPCEWLGQKNKKYPIHLISNRMTWTIFIIKVRNCL